jgi:hypothetical protein
LTSGSQSVQSVAVGAGADPTSDAKPSSRNLRSNAGDKRPGNEVEGAQNREASSSSAQASARGAQETSGVSMLTISKTSAKKKLRAKAEAAAKDRDARMKHEQFQLSKEVLHKGNFDKQLGKISKLCLVITSNVDKTILNELMGFKSFVRKISSYTICSPQELCRQKGDCQLWEA